MDASIQQYRGILPMGHTERLGAGQAGARDLALAVSAERQQRRGDTTVFGDKYVVGAASRSGVHRFEHDAGGVQSVTQRG